MHSAQTSMLAVVCETENLLNCISQSIKMIHTSPHTYRDSNVFRHLFTIVVSVSMCFCFSILKHKCEWRSCSGFPVCYNLGGKTMGWFPWQYAPNCCYMVLEGYMLLLFLYVVAYFPDLGSVGNNDCCCRSIDVGNFFFLFHIYLPDSPNPLNPPPLLSLSSPISSIEIPFSDSLTPPSILLLLLLHSNV